MRPDEHKKKRSAQYKKKHGMTEKGDPGPGAEDKKSGKKQQKPSKKEKGNSATTSAKESSEPSADASLRLRALQLQGNTGERSKSISSRTPIFNSAAENTCVINSILTMPVHYFMCLLSGNLWL
jgi:hypothetical protein